MLIDARQIPPTHGSAGTPGSFLVFAATWIALGIAYWIFYGTATYETKKSLHPFLMIGAGVIFLGYAEWLTHGNVPAFFIVVLIVIMYLNIRFTRFCSQCGATIFSRGYSRYKFCPKCGAVLP